ncbi:DUF3626 domain-containing protein [Kineococcus sp. DHX-1]|uniref:DUF3626 domain-containing protein n=1 Tax=Kineococcus sp. DHX-1 TaxID=3349638 RepID=UPI0036D2D0F7
MTQSGGDRAARAVAHVRARARGGPLPPDVRVTVHFHPDRPAGADPSGRPRATLEAIAADGVYLSQFATGTSGGGLTAHPGGDRWVWESRLFGGAYDDAPPRERPVYGSLDHRHRPAGGSVRFGSAHLRLRPDVLRRSTSCWPDSAFGPVAVGTLDRCDLLDWLDSAADLLDPLQDPLDGYVEAHVHGPLVLVRDVEALVLDPSYRGPVPPGVRIERHAGFALRRSDFTRPEVVAYRGPDVAAAGAALAQRSGGTLDPAGIGAAAWAGEVDGQTLKRVWHCLARFGFRG